MTNNYRIALSVFILNIGFADSVACTVSFSARLDLTFLSFYDGK